VGGRPAEPTAHRYLDRLPGELRARLAEVNRPGLTALAESLRSSRVVAILGAETSAPLYPPWNGLVTGLAEAAYDQMPDHAADECRAMAAANNTDAVVELVRRHLEQSSFREVLRQVFRAKRDPVTLQFRYLAARLIRHC